MRLLRAHGNRQDFYTIVLGTYVLVTIYAILHDQYIVRISPEHFTIYHAPLWGIKDPPLLAAAYAFCAAPIPALALGCACGLVSLALPGRWPPLTPKRALLGVVYVIILAELASAVSGIYAWTTGDMLYGHNWYPDKSLELVTTQTIQLTCYLTSASYSCVLLLLLVRKRQKAGTTARRQA